MRKLTTFVALVCGLALAACGGKDNAGEADVPGAAADSAEVVGADGDAKTDDILGSDACEPCCEESESHPWTRECGDNCCGGSCGECPDGSVCADSGYGNRVCFSYDECPDVCAEWGASCGQVAPFFESETEGEVVCDCGGCAEGEECTGSIEANQVCCPTCATACAQAGMECGDMLYDWCFPSDAGIEGGCDCGECPDGQICVGAPDSASSCCVPSCEGIQCGDDGCGGECGSCPPGDACIGGACECVPDCMVDEYLSECGTSDGCGGSCGECGEDEVCALADYAEIGVCFNPAESCPAICIEESGECGEVWSGFVWPDSCDCGECPGPQDQCIDNACVCQPQEEDCDGLDNDCDGATDEDFPDESLDGIPDCCQPQYDGIDPAKDNCPWMKNPDQKDTDWDGIGDVCDEDDDDDGWDDWEDCEPQSPSTHPGAVETCDGVDNDCDGKIDEGFPDVNNDGLADCLDLDDDGDGVSDYVDNCPFVPNPLQEDSDGDSSGDACDEDWDNDGKPNLADNCPFAANPDQEDADGNGVGDICEGEDLDGDGTPDGLDCMPKNGKVHPGAQELCDAWDNDCDGEVNEGFPYPEAYFVFGNCVTPDEDKDGVGDPWDKCPGLANPGNADLDKDGLGDACDDDIDGDGALNADDCEPADASVFPGAPEKCDNKDNDCDGETDEGAAETDCQDCDPCTWDECDPAKGCLHESVECPEGQACNAWGKCE